MQPCLSVSRVLMQKIHTLQINYDLYFATLIFKKDAVLLWVAIVKAVYTVWPTMIYNEQKWKNFKFET